MLVSAGTIEQVILDRAQQKKEIDAKVIQASYASAAIIMHTDKSLFIDRHLYLLCVDFVAGSKSFARTCVEQNVLDSVLLHTENVVHTIALAPQSLTASPNMHLRRFCMTKRRTYRLACSPT